MRESLETRLFKTRRVFNERECQQFVHHMNLKDDEVELYACSYRRRCLVGADFRSSDRITGEIVALLRLRAEHCTRVRVELMYALYDARDVGMPPLRRIKRHQAFTLEYDTSVSNMTDEQLRAIMGGFDVTSTIECALACDEDVCGHVMFCPLSFDLYAEQ